MKRYLLFLAAAMALASARPAPAQIITALTSTGQLITVNSAAPGTLIGAPVTVTGLNVSESLVAIDYRPIDNALIGVTYFPLSGVGSAFVYSINPTTGAAAQINATPIPVGPIGSFTKLSIDFNPAANALRILTNNSVNNNYRVTLGGTGSVNADTDLNPGAPSINGIAYDRNLSGTALTTLFGISQSGNNLVTIGGVDGSPSPNLGQVFNVANVSGVAAGSLVGFDIASGTNNAFVATPGQLFALNLANGTTTNLGTFPGGFVIADIASPVPEPGSLTLCGLAAGSLLGAGRRRLRANVETAN